MIRQFSRQNSLFSSLIMSTSQPNYALYQEPFSLASCFRHLRYGRSARNAHVETAFDGLRLNMPNVSKYPISPYRRINERYKKKKEKIVYITSTSTCHRVNTGLFLPSECRNKSLMIEWCLRVCSKLVRSASRQPCSLACRPDLKALIWLEA